jgi:hypothetical protein
LIAEGGRMSWQSISGYNWRALVGADIGRFKRVLGNALCSRIERCRVTEVVVAVHGLTAHFRGGLRVARDAPITKRDFPDSGYGKKAGR